MNATAGKPRLWFGVFVVFIDALGLGIIIPILPDLLEELTGRGVNETAFVGGALMAIYALNQFLLGPIVGALSDQFGRRPLILFCLGMLTLDYILMAVSWSVWVLFLGRFLAGLAGASYSVATAYITDISERDKRSANIGLIGAAFGMGFIFGPILGGLAGAWDVRAPFWVAAALCAFGVSFGMFAQPESLSRENRRPFSFRNSNPFAALMRAFALPGLGGFLLCYFLVALGGFTYPAIWAYWGKEVFGWSPAMIGFSLAAYGIGSAIVQGGLIRVVIPRLGEPRTVWLGLAMAVVALFLFAFAWEPWMVFAIIPIACLSHLYDAGITGLMTKQVSDSEQGELQGVIGALAAVTSVVTPLAATAIFFATADREEGIYFPGAPYFLAGLVTLFCVIPLARGLRRARLT